MTGLWLPSDDDLELLTPEELELLEAELQTELQGSWEPQPKQQIAEDLAHQVDELLYGGARGGGKTEWLLEHAIAECERHPGNRWVIFRRVYPSLLRTIVPRAIAKLTGGRAEWNGSEKVFRFPNRSELWLSHLTTADTSHQAWLGVELGGVGFEELTEFEKHQYEFLLTSLRAPAAGIFPHACATTNPGGRGHPWVKRRWIRPRLEDLADPEGGLPAPMEPWVALTASGKPSRRAFVPAVWQDNPAGQVKDPGYLDRVLAAVSDKGLRKALAEGDWDAIDLVEGALWIQADLDAGRVQPGHIARIGGTRRRCVAVDPSDGTDEGDAYGVWAGALAVDGAVYTEHSYEWRGPVRQLAERTISLYEDTRSDAIVVERNHGGAWLREVLATVDPDVPVVEVWASDGKRTRARPISVLASMDQRERDPRRRRKSRLVGHHPDLEEQLTTWIEGADSPNMLDAFVWGHAWLLGKASAAPKRTTRRDRRLTGRR